MELKAQNSSGAIRSPATNVQGKRFLPRAAGIALWLIMAAFIPLHESVTTLGAAEPISFERQVLPLLEAHCNRCHHREQQRGGLDLTRLSTMRRGGDELGPAIVPGKPDESPMIQVLTGDQEPMMPEGGDQL